MGLLWAFKGAHSREREMEIRDLGEIEGEVVLFGGPYSNLQATQALLASLEGRRAICTGDLVAYCARPKETVELIRDAGIPVVAGNCEKQLAAGALDCGCGFEDGTACDLLSAGWYAYANAHVSQEERAWMGELPDLIAFTHQGKRYGVLHGGVSDIARFLWPSDEDDAFQSEIDLAERHLGPLDAIIAGHSGIPFQRQIGARLWINAGVIGMPPHDGRAETRYAVLGPSGIMFHRLEYDAKAAAEDMKQAGLVQGYHKSLITGVWPSEDVLPSQMRQSLASG